MHIETPADDPAHQRDEAPLPFGVMLFSVAAVFSMPVIVLIYAGYTAAHHSPQDLSTAARRAVERGQSIEARFVSLSDGGKASGGE